MNLEALTAQLEAANLQTHTLTDPHHGGAVVITPHGGRIMGLFTQKNSANLYFTNPELASPASAEKFLAGEHVLGGDRVWVAPERGLFFKGETLDDGVVTQRSIDPGDWHIAQRSQTCIRLVNEFTATYFHHANRPIRGIIERTIRLIKSPFAHAPDLLPGGVHHASYEIASTFRLLESPHDSLHFGLWFLIQLVVPNGGYLYVPTTGKAVITHDYYEPTGPDYLKVTDSPHAHVRFKLDSINRHKIGIRATEVLGRAAYLSNADSTGRATLVVRNFLNNPSAHYSDVPLHTPTGTQDSIQCYNHNSGPSGFGELEFHTPGINRMMPDPVVHDTNQVWSFTGPRTDLVKIAAFLLNLPREVLHI